MRTPGWLRATPPGPFPGSGVLGAMAKGDMAGEAPMWSPAACAWVGGGEKQLKGLPACAGEAALDAARWMRGAGLACWPRSMTVVSPEDDSRLGAREECAEPRVECAFCAAIKKSAMQGCSGDPPLEASEFMLCRPATHLLSGVPCARSDCCGRFRSGDECPLFAQGKGESGCESSGEEGCWSASKLSLLISDCNPIVRFTWASLSTSMSLLFRTWRPLSAG